MIARKVLAAVVFVFGVSVFAAPAGLRLGWVASLAGMVLGVALGSMAGVMWHLATEAERRVARMPNPEAVNAESDHE